MAKSFLKAVFSNLFLGDINEAAGNPYCFTESVILPGPQPPLKLFGNGVVLNIAEGWKQIVSYGTEGTDMTAQTL